MDSNRVRLSLIRESTLGTSPSPMRMRTARITSESLKYVPVFFTPGEIRSDRMSPDPTKQNEENTGAINFEMSFPVDNTFLSELYQSAFLNTWTLAPVRDNNYTANSITAVATSTNIVTIAAGSNVPTGALVLQSGFTNAANNGLFLVSAGGSTSYTCSTATFATETPPTTARAKVVGFRGASADITATATGLGSTALNFTTLGLSVGQWIKIGGTAAATKFATAALNDWARITAIAANALTLDNLPSGWATDTGTGKTISVFFGDVLRNGTTLIGVEIERSYLDQATPTHILQKGMAVNKLTHNFATEAAITGSFEFIGMSGAQSTTAIGSQYDAVPTTPVMTGNVSVGRIAEAGSTIVAPNWAKSLQLSLNNNIRMITALGTVGAVTLGVGEVDVTGTLETFFGSNALLAKLMAGTVSALSCRQSATNSAGQQQAVLFTLPRVTFSDGSPNAGGKNQDVTLPLQFITSFDSLTNCEIDLQRVEYFET